VTTDRYLALAAEALAARSVVPSRAVVESVAAVLERAVLEIESHRDRWEKHWAAEHAWRMKEAGDAGRTIGDLEVDNDRLRAENERMRAALEQMANVDYFSQPQGEPFVQLARRTLRAREESDDA
jgi:hypothetical protein